MPSPEKIRRRCLPHWDVDGAPYFVTTCLEGSIPARGQLDIADYRSNLEKRLRPANLSDKEWKLNRWKLVFACMDRWLDIGPAVRHLADPSLAKEVVEAIFHFAAERYDLLAYVVMPSHIHWVFRPLENWVKSLSESVSQRSARERIVHSINRHTALRCNKLLKTEGSFWQHESYDHWVRDSEELERIIMYIENNPVKAGLVASPNFWSFSSAQAREELRLEFGEPLKRWNPCRLETGTTGGAGL